MTSYDKPNLEKILYKYNTYIKNINETLKNTIEQIKYYKDKYEQMEEEIEKIKDKYSCSVCFTNTRNIIFEPCNHFVCCKDCGIKLNKCPICRSDIISLLLVFGN